MVKIFLTGDNHIGLKYASHPQSAALSGARISAFETMVELANDGACDLFVVAGDLFENVSGVSKKDVAAVTALLAQFHGTVAILPGNHDYFTPEARVWQYFLDAAADRDNLLLLTEPRPYELELACGPVTLYPALCTARHSAPGENGLDWIKAQEFAHDGRVSIGVAHGAVEGETIDREGRYFQMTRQELEAIPMDLWLLGHTHVPFGGGRIFNAGTHVQTDVACGCAGQCYVLTLEEDRVDSQLVITGDLRFVRRQVALTAGQMEADLTHAVADLPDRAVVELILTGAVNTAEYENREAVLTALLARFVEGTWQDFGLSRQISRELIEAQFPETSFSAGLLTALLDEPRQAQLVYELLGELKEESV